MADDDDIDEVSDDDDEEGGGSSKKRASKEITELYYFVLALSLNNVSTKCEGLRKEEQEFKMIKESVDLLRTDFGMISRKCIGKSGGSIDCSDNEGYWRKNAAQSQACCVHDQQSSQYSLEGA